MSQLILNCKPFTIEQLTDSQTPRKQNGLSDYEVRVLQFCRQWLSGQETFTLQTSGSTGKPKPVPLTRAQMVTSAHLTGAALGLQEGDRALVCLSVDYIAGMMMLVRGFELGLQLTVIDPVSNPLAQFPSEVTFDFTALVPLQLQETLTASANEGTISDQVARIKNLNEMKGILIGGAPVSLALDRQLQLVSAPIYHTYGMTETVTHIALKRLNGPQKSERFLPLAGIKLGLDKRGCLTIQSALTRGQILLTNDLVDLQPDGSFTWLGRFDNVINSGGVKVQVEKVERALEDTLHHYQAGLFAARRFFVGPLSHPRFGQSVVAVIEGPPLSNDTDTWPEVEATLRTDLQKSLTLYEIPRTFYFVDRLLETPTGKIDRLANLAKIGREGGY